MTVTKKGQKLSSLLFSSLLALMLSLAGCEDDSEKSKVSPKLKYSVTEPSSADDPILLAVIDDEPYWHPIMNGGKTPDGVVLYDVKDDPNGDRYIIVDEISEDENGNVTKFSGVRTIAQVPLTAEEIKEIENDTKNNRIRKVDTAPRLDPQLGTYLSTLGSDVPIEVVMHLKEPVNHRDLSSLYDKAIADGNTRTMGARRLLREQLVEEQKVEVADVVSEVRRTIENIGGKIVATCKATFCLSALMNINQIMTLLASDPNVERIDLVREITDAALTGNEVSNGSQLKQFHDSDYMGDHNWAQQGKVIAGAVESTKVNYDHVAFDTIDNGVRNRRLFGFYDCTSSCVAQTTWSPAGSHSTAVCGIMAGDLTEGQDAGVTGTTSRIERSGYGRDAWFQYWRATTSSQTILAFDSMISDGYSPDIANHSAGS